MSRKRSWKGVRLFTIGHSTRSLDELVALLRSFDVTILADIRTIPRSRHNPQFNADALASELPARSLEYVHLRALGGLRHARPGSINTGWHNASFAGTPTTCRPKTSSMDSRSCTTSRGQVASH